MCYEIFSKKENHLLCFCICEMSVSFLCYENILENNKKDYPLDSSYKKDGFMHNSVS